MKHADYSSEHGSSFVAQVTNTMGRFVDQAKEGEQSS
jgi:hypothetical protein